MKRAFSIILPCLLLLLLLFACGPSHRERLQQLEALEVRNSADSLMTDDSLATVLAEFFDDHGTPNERMRAHYILGRTYADRGEAPAALEAYLDAAASADTTAADCDWAKLSRVYGQMSAVFYSQGLMRDYLAASDKSIHCAWLAKDTLQALQESLLKLAAYDRLQQPDSVIQIFDSLYLHYGQSYIIPFANCSTIPIRSLLTAGRLESAKEYMTLYEEKSGCFDSLGNLLPGREIFYYYKGDLMFHCQQYDSAEFYFRKLLNCGLDAVSQNMASYGLAKLFAATELPDSASKYAIYGYEMNDSAYKYMAIEETENVVGLYNYNRHLRISNEERAKAEKERSAKLYLIIVLLLLVTAFLLLFAIVQKRKRLVSMKYQKSVFELNLAKSELIYLQEKILVYKRQIEEEHTAYSISETELSLLKEREKSLSVQIEMLQAEISKYKDLKLLADAQNDSLLTDLPVYKKLLVLSSKGRKLSTEEWMELDTMIKDVFPAFYVFLAGKKNVFTDYEYKICMLYRLHIKMKQTAGLIGIAKSQVSTISTGLLKTLFNEDGSGKELKKRLEGIG